LFVPPNFVRFFAAGTPLLMYGEKYSKHSTVRIIPPLIKTGANFRPVITLDWRYTPCTGYLSAARLRIGKRADAGHTPWK